MSALLDFDQIRLDHLLPSVVGAVVPLQRAGNEFKACCPLHADHSPSFTIYEGGKRFQCFGCGAGGDVLDFVQRLHGVGLREAAAMLTGGEMPAVSMPAMPDETGPDRTAEATAIWGAAQPIKGTLAETYLRCRAINIPLPDCLRFSRLRYGTKGPDHPCLVAAVTGRHGHLIGIQRTFLNGSGTGKAAVPKAKLSLGRVAGGSIQLAPEADSLVVCEGLEDGLSLQQVLGRAVWVAAGASMLPAMRFPDRVREVVIGGDNDDAGRAAARKAAQDYALRGLRTRVFFPLDAKDYNQELMERART